MQSYVFGADVGGTSIKLGLFTTAGQLVEKGEIPTDLSDGGGQILPDIAGAVLSLLSRRGIAPEAVAGIGLAVPGPVDEDCVVHRCVNLGWGVFNLRERMNALLPAIPRVAAGNDANVAALGELWQGGGKGADSAVLFTLGTGVGGGVVVGGRIIPGAFGGAGEVGHMTVEPQETRLCACGKRGCLEQYASASGIVRLAADMLAESPLPSALRHTEGFTAREICDLAREGEEMAALILNRFGDYMGRALSYVACAVDPEIFIIGGGMSRAGAVVIDAIAAHYRRYAFHVSAGTPIVPAVLGNDAGIYGCAKLVLP